MRVLRRTASAEAGSASCSAMAGGSCARLERCGRVSRPGSTGSEVPPASLTVPRAETCPARGGGGSRRSAQDRCSGGVPSPASWQLPFLNVFRHFRVDEWKRSSKEGDVALVTVLAGGLPAPQKSCGGHS